MCKVWHAPPGSTDRSLSKYWEMVKDREVWGAGVCGVTESDRTEQLNNKSVSREPTASAYLGACYTVQFSGSVVSDSLQPQESQHPRPPCPSQTPGVHSDSRPPSPWCHPAISSSVVPFSSCPESFPASESFPMSQPFASGGQNIRASDSAKDFPMNI